ncbi:hypothetical protein [Neobacillus drentensis]|uniref:hypothetical protein n=1 Tax=Neobacillus drentensis TaxID=220684 RepID=UPI003001755D
MSQNSVSEKVDIIKVDPKDVQIVESNSLNSSSSNSNGSIGKEIATTFLAETAKAAAPVLIEIIKGKLDDDRDEKKKIRESRREILLKEFNILIQNLEKEEAKEDYNQERIDRWNERIDKIKQELNDTEEKTNGFTKWLLNSFKELVSSKSGSKE